MSETGKANGDAFERVREELLPEPGVEEGQFFAAQGLKANDRIFAMRMKDAMVVKLPAERVSALIRTGTGRQFTSGGGRVMREWVTIPGDREAEWRALAREALEFNRNAGSKPKRRQPLAAER